MVICMTTFFGSFSEFRFIIAGGTMVVTVPLFCPVRIGALQTVVKSKFRILSKISKSSSTKIRSSDVAISSNSEYFGPEPTPIANDWIFLGSACSCWAAEATWKCIDFIHFEFGLWNLHYPHSFRRSKQSILFSNIKCTSSLVDF